MVFLLCRVIHLLEIINADISRMNSATTAVKQTLTVKEILYYFLVGLAIAAVIAAIIYGIYTAIRRFNYNKSHISTPENNARITAEQINKYEGLYLADSKLPAYQVAANGLKASSLTIPPLKEDELALINYSMITADNAGYIGPLENGVFAEEDAVRIAYRAGARAFILRVDYMDSSSTKDPVLIVRNKNGDKISNNVGSIRRVAQAIAAGMPRGAAAEPVFVILFFQRLPNKNTHSKESLNFMGKVAEALEPLKDRLLGLTSDGDFRRQAQQDTMFLKPRAEFDGKFIVMTNIDTSGFRVTDGTRAVKAGADLDLYTHARLFCDTTTGLGMTVAPENSKTQGAFAETINYFINIPEERMATTVAKTKVQWTIALDASTGPALKPETLKTLLDKLGVCSVPINIFDENTAAIKEGAFSKAYYGLVSYRPKVPEVRFVIPKPVALAIPNKQLDARGGYLPVPKA